MVRYSPDFKSILQGIEFNKLEENPNSVYALNEKLEFIYFNQAWFDFAKRNDGEPHISNTIKIGSFILDSITGELKEFYSEKLKEVIEKREVFRLNYECSSASVFRIFRAEFFPLIYKKGVLVINSKMIEEPKQAIKVNEIHKIDLKLYLDELNFFNQCSNCRKTNKNNSNQWDWIPSLVDNKVTNVSHTICPICYDFYWKQKSQG